MTPGSGVTDGGGHSTMVQVPLNELFERALDVVAQLAGNASSLNAILRGDTGCGVELMPHVRELMDTIEHKSEECIQQLDSIATNVAASTADLVKASDATDRDTPTVVWWKHEAPAGAPSAPVAQDFTALPGMLHPQT